MRTYYGLQRLSGKNPKGSWPFLLNMNIARTRFRLDRRTASIDGSADVMLVRGPMRSHGERRIRLDRTRARLRIQREMSVAQPQ